MVCCMIIAALFGLLTRPLLALRTSPLAWRPDAATGAVHPALRATGRVQSFVHAFAGLDFVIRNEPNMRIHLAIAALAICAGLWLQIEASEWRWLIMAMAIVLATEAMNTGIEQACNAISRSFHPAIKAAKDVAAGAVLIASIAAALIGASIFLPRLAGMVRGGAGLPNASICGGRI